MTKLEGLMWAPDTPGEALSTTITNAVTRFRQKFGCAPGVVYVNKERLDGILSHAEPVDGLDIRAGEYIGKNLVWVVKENGHEESIR